MKLKKSELLNKEVWEKSGIELPQFDLEKMKADTLMSPTWIHFGAGNIFRGFMAVVQQELVNKGLDSKGILVAEGFDYEIIEKAYKPFDNLSLLVILKSDGTIQKKVVGSVADVFLADSENTAEWNRLCKVFENPSLQMASFTITEKGYNLTGTDGSFMPAVQEDFKNAESPKSIMGKITALCYKRFLKGQLPLALVSMDNCSHNGDKLYQAVRTIAQKWTDNNLVQQDFLDYINDKNKVSFPWTMIDKITPRPDAKVQKMLNDSGFEDTELIITDKNTYTAPFVNAEQAQYLVVEDCFPNGRPPLELAGVLFTDRETVNKSEKMKVCTCLNPLHTALAIFGCLLSFQTIHEEMENDVLSKLVEKIGYVEGMPVVVDPKIINPAVFLKEVLNVRLPNPFMPDTPQRIATDTSQKLPIRFGETLREYLCREDLDILSLELIPLVFAGWCRYLMGVNDDGKPFELSSDPMLAELQSYLKELKLGDNGPFTKQLSPILSNEKIFGFNLYEIEIAEKTEKYFEKFISGENAVYNTLKTVLENY